MGRGAPPPEPRLAGGGAAGALQQVRAPHRLSHREALPCPPLTWSSCRPRAGQVPSPTGDMAEAQSSGSRPSCCRGPRADPQPPAEGEGETQGRWRVTTATRTAAPAGRAPAAAQTCSGCLSSRTTHARDKAGPSVNTAEAGGGSGAHPGSSGWCGADQRGGTVSSPRPCPLRGGRATRRGEDLERDPVGRRGARPSGRGHTWCREGWAWLERQPGSAPAQVLLQKEPKDALYTPARQQAICIISSLW